MPAFHAIVWLDRSEAHVILFDREHIAAQKIKSRSHHKATGGHSSGGQLAAMASCTFSNTTR